MRSTRFFPVPDRVTANAGMNANTYSTTDSWRETQLVVESLSELAKANVAPLEFYGDLSRSLAELTQALSCKIWVRETSPSNQAWKTITKFCQQENITHLAALPETQCAKLVAVAASAETETFLAAGSEIDGESKTVAPLDMFFHRAKVGDEVVAVIQLDHKPGTPQSHLDGAKHLASVGAEISGEFHRNWHYRQLFDREKRREKLDRFIDSIHRSYDLRSVAFATVAEGKELLDCDRVSLLQKRRGRRAKVIAVSGVRKPDRRSPTVRCIEKLANSKIRSRDPLWFDPTSEEDHDTRLKNYFGETNAEYLGLLPLVTRGDSNRKPQRIGTLFVEIFDAEKDFDKDLLQSRSNWLVRHASNAIGNAVQIDRLPFLSFSRWLDRLTRGKRIPWFLLFFAGMLAAIGYLAFMPTDFEISARGELVPATRESIYAPRPGTVVEFPFLTETNDGGNNAQGTLVKPGDTLVRLENAELDYELTSLLGEQATVDQQLETIAASIGQFGGRDAESRKRYEELTAQSSELKVKQTSIGRRIGLVNKERERLSVKAGIRGRVLTWDIVNELKLRPVQQGDFLLEIVDVQDDWEIELFVRDRHIGYVKQAQKDLGESKPLAISFFHLSDPEKRYIGEIKSIAMATDVYPEHGSAVRVTGTIEATDGLADFRPGTTLVAKIECGKKPLAYVLCYDLIHTIRLWGLF